MYMNVGAFTTYKATFWYEWDPMRNKTPFKCISKKPVHIQQETHQLDKGTNINNHEWYLRNRSECGTVLMTQYNIKFPWEGGLNRSSSFQTGYISHALEKKESIKIFQSYSSWPLTSDNPRSPIAGTLTDVPCQFLWNAQSDLRQKWIIFMSSSA